jgi:hypothetical protein
MEFVRHEIINQQLPAFSNLSKSARPGLRLDSSPTHLAECCSSLQAVEACRARKTALWLVCRVPPRSLLGAQQNHVSLLSHGASCVLRDLRPLPIRVYPAVDTVGVRPRAIPRHRLHASKRSPIFLTKRPADTLMSSFPPNLV